LPIPPLIVLTSPLPFKISLPLLPIIFSIFAIVSVCSVVVKFFKYADVVVKSTSAKYPAVVI
jgi:hypothetical protein